MFTFPTDSNNKAGVIKLKNQGQEFAIPAEQAGYDDIEVWRQTLIPNTDTAFTFTARCEKFDIHNFGPGDIYLKLETAAAIDGSDCIYLPDGMGYPLCVRGSSVHVISTNSPTVQIVGVR